MPPQVYTAKLSDKMIHNQKFTQFKFELVEPNRMEFEAGQYVSIAVNPEGHRRSYSICSTPDDNHGFETLVDVQPNGMGVQFLNDLKFGDEVKILAPMGNFVIQSKTPEVPIVFVATGSGISPLWSMLFDQIQQHQNARRMTLYWGLRHEADLCWEDDLKDLIGNFPNVTFHPVISQAEGDWPLCRGRVTDCLSIHQINLSAEYYLCGNKPMIEDVTTILIKRGVPQEKISHEKFY